LVDQISAYEAHPDPLRYLTRFLDGLTPAVRVLVAIQQPVDLDAAYTMALLYEELGDGSNPWSAQFVTPPPPPRRSRRWHSSTPSTSVSPDPPLPAPPTRWVSKSVEEKKGNEARNPSDDKCAKLKAYRRAKGMLCLW
jgi:hypothetical protein